MLGIITPKQINRLSQNLAPVIMFAMWPRMTKFKPIAPVGASPQIGEISLCAQTLNRRYDFDAVWFCGCLSQVIAFLEGWVITVIILMRSQQNWSFLDHTGKDPSEDRNRNCRRTSGIPTNKIYKKMGQETKSLVSKYWCTRQASTSNHSICALWTSKNAFDSTSRDKLWVTMMDMGYPLQLIDC